MFKIIKDFFVKETEWGFPFKKKATKFSQWYVCILVFIGFYKLSEWIFEGLMVLWETIFNAKHVKIKHDVMEESETE